MAYILFFFFNDTATTEIYTLSLHDALPISHVESLYLAHHGWLQGWLRKKVGNAFDAADLAQSTFLKVLGAKGRSEEHTSELQSPCNLVCRLLLEKKKKKKKNLLDKRIYKMTIDDQ